MALQFDARLEERDFDVSIHVEQGSTLAVLGPNGAGKSTLLNSLAGLLRPDAGRAELEGRVLFDLEPDHRPVWLAPHARGVSLLAQQALLFPHLTARDNVAFGPVSAGVSRSKARVQADSWLEAVEATEFAGRRPVQLSGGQAQRIAVARALASEPRLLLLDEPMAALDVTITPTLRRMFRRVLADRTVILVTHDVVDAYTLADRVAVMNEGRIVDIGPTAEVLRHPRSPFTAALIAQNLITGTRTREGLVTAEGARFGADPSSPISVGEPVAATISPAAVGVSTAEPAEGAAYVVRASVTDLESRGDLIRVRAAGLFADVTPSRLAELDLVPGSTVWLRVLPSAVTMYSL